jgi:exonuclease VII large subunit
LEVYAARGTYQVSIDKMHVVGMGVLESRLLLLREKLLQEGLLILIENDRCQNFQNELFL